MGFSFQMRYRRTNGNEFDRYLGGISWRFWEQSDMMRAVKYNKINFVFCNGIRPNRDLTDIANRDVCHVIDENHISKKLNQN